MSDAITRFRDGGVIPAHPLALDAGRRLDERRQRALSRYYIESGSLGLAVGVHTTQFELHSTHRDLFAPVLALAADTAAEYGAGAPLLVAGVAGGVEQAVTEARIAAEAGYDFVLLTPYGATDATDDELVERAVRVAEVLPVIGFYLQAAIGGRRLGAGFWRRFAEVPGVIGVKIAPFDRYATLEVARGVAASGRSDVALYTGNDDSIVVDLMSRLPGRGPDESPVALPIVGGLLGQWAVWTRQAVSVHARARRAQAGDHAERGDLARLAPVLTDANGAIFDVANRFAGCVPGIHEVLRRQGLLAGTWCLDERESLSPGQSEEISRVIAAYPELHDDEFVAAHRDRWLS
ncbi:dihydrodipicolinate synthase family protein [Promicromonospora sp. NPDC023987]|uniref:dihydrodipicolinate synthase family protein n=1 Tax=Promicromonospora sp. NPDC023987 TaxID=3155360 RepID=UPI0033E55FCA